MAYSKARPSGHAGSPPWALVLTTQGQGNQLVKIAMQRLEHAAQIAHASPKLVTLGINFRVDRVQVRRLAQQQRIDYGLHGQSRTGFPTCLDANMLELLGR
jgi:hypothetical protein